MGFVKRNGGMEFRTECQAIGPAVNVPEGETPVQIIKADLSGGTEGTCEVPQDVWDRLSPKEQREWLVRLEDRLEATRGTPVICQLLGQWVEDLTTSVEDSQENNDAE